MPVLQNQRHERFAQEVAQGRTASEAYELAGYKPHRGNAARMSSDESIRRRVLEIQSAAAERVGVTVERVVAELSKIAFADLRRAVKWRANVTSLEADPETDEQRLAVTNEVVLVDSDKLDDEIAGAIAEVSQTDRGGLKIKMHDKLSALEKLGKHLGMFVERHDHTVTVSHEDALAELE